MRLNIEHVTGFSYSTGVGSSYNEARMTPVTNSTQTVWSNRLTIAPSAWAYTYLDYWGTTVTAFELHDRHSELTVTSQGVVETHADPHPEETERRVADADLDWTAMRSTRVTDAMSELLGGSVQTDPDPELAGLADDIAADQPPRLAALDVCQAIGERVAYQPGATGVTSTASEAWVGGHGVCQDFSHVAIGALRHVGIPTRYVSGYLHPHGADARAHESVTGESHSWIEFWVGDWVPYDPSSGRMVTEHYVRVGHGRHYHDVPPLRGTYSGGPSEMFVTVTLTQIG